MPSRFIKLQVRNTKIQKFVNDKLPTIPFNFVLYGTHNGRPEVETVENEATNEQFSVSNSGFEVEVKRTQAAKKNGKTSKKVNRKRSKNRKTVKA